MSVRFLATCFIQSPLGPGVMPQTHTRRVAMSMTNKTWWRTSPNGLRTSTVNRSIAAIAPQCALMKVLHDMLLPRFGAGRDTVVCKDPFDGIASDFMSEVLECAS